MPSPGVPGQKFCPTDVVCADPVGEICIECTLGGGHGACPPYGMVPPWKFWVLGPQWYRVYNIWYLYPVLFRIAHQMYPEQQQPLPETGRSVQRPDLGR